jgi:ribonuclease BN (tRNA processing enzyme)
MLQFAGTGGAFDTDEYPSSAYFLERRKDKPNENFLFIIDAGGGILHRYKELWEGTSELDRNRITRIYINITHLHADHVGDLSTLIYYFKLIAKVEDIRVICHYKLHDIIIRRLIEEGVKDVIISGANSSYNFEDFVVEYVRNKHIQNMKSYSLIIRKSGSDEVVIYSGDTKMFVLFNPKMARALGRLENGLNTKKVQIFQEVTLNPDVKCHTYLYNIPSIDEIKDCYLEELGFDYESQLKDVEVSLYHFDPKQLNQENRDFLDRTGIKICGQYRTTKFKLI